MEKIKKIFKKNIKQHPLILGLVLGIFHVQLMIALGKVELPDWLELINFLAVAFRLFLFQPFEFLSIGNSLPSFYIKAVFIWSLVFYLYPHVRKKFDTNKKVRRLVYSSLIVFLSMWLIDMSDTVAFNWGWKTLYSFLDIVHKINLPGSIFGLMWGGFLQSALARIFYADRAFSAFDVSYLHWTEPWIFGFSGLLYWYIILLLLEKKFRFSKKNILLIKLRTAYKKGITSIKKHQVWLAFLFCILLFVMLLFFPWLNLKAKYASEIQNKTYYLGTFDAGIVFGAHIREDGTPTEILEERLIAAKILLEEEKIKKIVVSNTKDAAMAMKEYLVIQHSIPERLIEVDTQASTTIDTCQTEFGHIEGHRNVVLLSQGYHLPRVMHLCYKVGIDRSKYYVNGFAVESVNYKDYNSVTLPMKLYIRGKRYIREAALTWASVLDLY